MLAENLLEIEELTALLLVDFWYSFLDVTTKL